MTNQTVYDRAQQAIEWCRDHGIDWAGYWMETNTICFGFLSQQDKRLPKVIEAMKGQRASRSEESTTDLYEVQTDSFGFRWHVWRERRPSVVSEEVVIE